MSVTRVEVPNYVSRETLERLDLYLSRIITWNKKINLVSKTSTENIWRRHIFDSLQLWPLMPKNTKTWVDMGSGAGFPIIPIACLAKSNANDIKFHAIESNKRKAEFIRLVSNELSLGISVHGRRIEECSSLRGDVVSARALSPLYKLLHSSQSLLSPGGTCIFPKGEKYKAEISKALEYFKFEVQIIPSITHSDAVILKVEDISRVKP